MKLRNLFLAVPLPMIIPIPVVIPVTPSQVLRGSRANAAGALMAMRLSQKNPAIKG